MQVKLARIEFPTLAEVEHAAKEAEAEMGISCQEGDAMPDAIGIDRTARRSCRD
ncbi:MAG: hypothetical protein KGL39_29345 [Patescibacteria group bacterium]|nr:hypothetical protein [Patescibacteria group bacterium]